MTPRYAFCSGCLCLEPVDANWRALWIDSDGRLLISPPEHGCDVDYERPNTVFACGQGSALVLTERYLQSAGFSLAKPKPQRQSHCSDEELIENSTLDLLVANLNQFAHA